MCVCVCVTVEWRWGMWVWHIGGREAVEGAGKGGGSSSVHERERVRCMQKGQALGLVHMFKASRDSHNHEWVSRVPLQPNLLRPQWCAFGRMAIAGKNG